MCILPKTRIDCDYIIIVIVQLLLVMCGFCFRCVNRNAKMVCSECPMVPVGAVRDCAVPAGRPAHLQRPQRRATDYGRTGRRRGHIRFRPDDTRRPDVPETQVSEDQQAVAPGTNGNPKTDNYGKT